MIPVQRQQRFGPVRSQLWDDGPLASPARDEPASEELRQHRPGWDDTELRAEVLRLAREAAGWPAELGQLTEDAALELLARTRDELRLIRSRVLGGGI